jgi:hypothetical protein
MSTLTIHEAEATGRVSVVPGAAVLARGIDIFARNASACSAPALKGTLFNLVVRTDDTQWIASDTGGLWQSPFDDKTYAIPIGVEFNPPDGPHPPATSNSERYESSREIATHLAIQSGIDVNYGAFSMSAEVSYSRETSSQASRTYFIYESTADLYSSQIAILDLGVESADHGFLAALRKLPKKFDPADSHAKAAFAHFFGACGTHLVVSTTIGAVSRLIVATESSKTSDATSIEADLKAAYSGIVSGHVSSKWGVQDTNFIKNSRIAFFGYGGDPTLAQQAANSIDTESNAFEKWFESTRTHPGVSSFEIKPLWEIVQQIDGLDDVADAIRDAFFYFAIGMTAVPMYHVPIDRPNVPGNKPFTEHFYSTFEGPPEAAGLKERADHVAFYVLPHDSIFASPPPPSLGLDRWPVPVVKLARYRLDSGVRLSTTALLRQDTDTHEEPERSSYLVGPKPIDENLTVTLPPLWNVGAVYGWKWNYACEMDLNAFPIGPLERILGYGFNAPKSPFT